MSSFRPPLRKRTVENSLTDELCCSEDHVSTQNSQEVLSCGFLPPKQLKRTPFRPPLRDLVSPGQSYITCILHEEEEERRGITSSGLTSNFELAPLSKSNNQDINNEGNTTLKSVPKKHHYYYHIGNRKIEQPAVKTVLHNRPVEATGNKPTTFSAEQNESRFKIFEFQLSQATEKSKPTSEISSEITKPNEKSLAQVSKYICICMCVVQCVTPAPCNHGHHSFH